MRFFITWPRCSFIRVKNSSLSRFTLETKGKMKEKERKRGAARKSKLNACIFNFNSVLRVKKRKIFYIYKIYIYIDRSRVKERSHVRQRSIRDWGIWREKRNPGGDSGYIRLGACPENVFHARSHHDTSLCPSMC